MDLVVIVKNLTGVAEGETEIAERLVLGDLRPGYPQCRGRAACKALIWAWTLVQAPEHIEEPEKSLCIELATGAILSKPLDRTDTGVGS